MTAIIMFDGAFRFLSNFYIAPLDFDGYIYPSVEHAYQASKTLRLEDRIQFQDKHLTASRAKYLGKQKLQLRSDWENVKLGTMAHLLNLKFQDQQLKQQLLETGDAQLIEGNTWHDRVWGSCYCNEARIAKFGRKEACKVPGQNLLGQLLMETRRQLQLPE